MRALRSMFYEGHALKTSASRPNTPLRNRHVLRVLSYNIHKGFTATNLNFILRQIKESIQLVNADVVFLQEVLGHHESKRSQIEDWPTQAQFEFLADKVWDHHAYGKNAVYTSGHHGNAILSRFPISTWDNIDISTNKLERRGLLHAALDVPGSKTPLHAVCLHLGLFETGRRQQILSLTKRIKSLVPPAAPLIIAGDFNDWTEKASVPLYHELGLTEAYRAVHHEYARTFPSWLPVLKLDRIYVRNLLPVSATALTGSPWDQLSDHVAVSAELKFTHGPLDPGK